MVAKVAIIGVTFNLTTMKPFMAPIPAPIIMKKRTTHTGEIFGKLFITPAAMHDIKLIAAPADKSMPPEITTNAWPNDAKPKPMGCIKNTFFKLRVLVKNSLAKVEKIMIAANITHTSRSGSIHLFTILFMFF